MGIVQVQKVTKVFGGVVGLNNIDLTLEKGEVRGLIGPNGAGKTTLFNVVSGFLKPTKGEIFLGGENITGLSPYEVARKGLVRTFQSNVYFGSFNVLENINIVLGGQRSEIGVPFEGGQGKPGKGIGKGEALEILDYVGIIGLKDHMARELSHGHQRILGMAIALAAKPKILLLDEPLTGMNEEERSRVGELVKKLNRELGITILLVEHHVRTVMSICNSITVLNFGQKIAEGVPENIITDENVIRAYLGKYIKNDP